MKKEDLYTLIQKQGVLPLFFHPDKAVSKKVLKALYDAGIRAVEYTNRGAAALENFKAMRSLCKQELPGMQLGVGTIKNKTDAQKFMEAEADFFISPGLVDEVGEVMNHNDRPWLPGCFSPSEIIKAENQGIQMIKLFPGSLLQPGFLKSIRSVFPNLLFMPTGGVQPNEENLREWFDAGSCAVGMGSKLIRKELLEQGAYDQIKEETLQVLQMITKIREK